MMYAFIRFLATIFLRSYFRKTLIYGRDKVPLKGPLILASNHPSAFMEASVLSTVMQRPIHFLVRGDMFHPRFHWLFEWTKQIPIYRKKDGIANLRKNAASFDLTHRKLGNGESVLIFPEAKTVLEKKMRPIQKGTAHLAFGAMPFVKPGEELIIQPVGVNFIEPRQPGTDVVIVFGEPFATMQASRDDRDAIDQFTQQLSDAMNPLIIQINDEVEKNYDLLASIYLRMIFENKVNARAHDDLKKIAHVVNDHTAINIMIDQTDEVLKVLRKNNMQDGIYFPDLIALNSVGLSMLALLKIIWLLAGGWIWRLVRSFVFSKIKTNTFQGPTSVGVFIVVFTSMAFLILILFLLLKISLIYYMLWLGVMWMGTLIRPPLNMILKLLSMNSNSKSQVRAMITELRKEVEVITGRKTNGQVIL